MTHAEDAVLGARCPRCGCHVRKHFECNCGEVHDDYCLNCGRWCSLGVAEHVELDQLLDAPCERGAVMHEHPSEEKTTRIDRYLRNIRRDRH